jgi:23S rRNA (uracil1939-C5)-methyltransferase
MPEPTLRPGTELDLTLTDMAYGGDAVGHTPEGVVFAWGGITGEHVTVVVESVKRDIIRGRVSAVATPAPERIAPPCPYFGPCGGCQWQHIAYPAQIMFKTHILREQLRRLGGIAPETLDAVLHPARGMADPWHYRNSSTFQVDAATGRLGYFRRDSHDVVAVDHCPISDPAINRMLAAFQALLDEQAQPEISQPERVDLTAPIPVAMRERQVSGLLRVAQVTIRVGSGHDAGAPGEAVLVLHTQPADPTRPPPGAQRGRPERGRGGRVTPRPAPLPAIAITRKAVRRWAEAQPGRVTVVEATSAGTLEPVGISLEAGGALSEDAAELTQRGVAGKQASAPPVQPLAVLRQRLAGQPYWVTPTAFFQVNTAQAEVLIERVRAALPPSVRLLVDAYCGVGTFAFALLAGGRVRRVVGIESDRAAIESARWTTLQRHLPATQVEWIEGRVEDTLPGLDLAPDVILLDPPRAGCAPRLIAYLNEHPVPRLIYVSCDPSTLARDIKALAPTYRLVSAQVVDLFPQTFHIETVAVLDAV